MTTEKRGFKWMRAEIERLDPEVDSERIVRLTGCRLLPKSLLVVHLFYTVGFIRFAGPPVSAESVDRDGTGMLYEHGFRRADETMFHLFSWIDDGVSSPTSLESLDYVRNWHSGVARNWPMPMHTFRHSAAVFTLSRDHRPCSLSWYVAWPEPPCSPNAMCYRIRVRCSASATSSPSTRTRRWANLPSVHREPHVDDGQHGRREPGCGRPRAAGRPVQAPT
ncbi:hypothetical protein [Nocardia cyriacigeorgica]|uniref:hypothetical protein n=1 Tax=Nocardia cyriacigeorgica TaxID=135487 RepID=UPI000CEB8064|nr:hypothetical protein [Nocardia cyriacigeorgica]AVH23727.1 hypothetical protein C5B73_22190 [Nocardia cyriacigeorgica]